jgi:protein involved in polysaccharide export with SLBB domain
MRTPPFRPLIVAAALLLAALPAAAQADGDAVRGQPTRPELERMLARATEAARAPGASDEARMQAANEAALIRGRLRDGDLQPGDQVSLEVEGEQALTATFTVAPGRVLDLPGMEPLSLEGVLRTELEARVAAHVARYIRQPVVHARALMRVAVTGQVARPGFYAVPAESMVSDAIMAAGGPTSTGKLAAARIERGGERIWTGRSLQQAVQYGLTLDQMSLRSGDQIVIPQDTGSRSAAAMRYATVIPATLLAVVGILQLF